MSESLASLPVGAKTFHLLGFAETGGVHHAFSTRHGGLPPGGGRAALAAFLRAGGFPPAASAIRLRQVHGGDVHRAGHRQASDAGLPHADAAVTDKPGLVLTVQTADCVPVLLADMAAGVVAAAHVGWRGAVAGVLAHTMDAMRELGALPPNVAAAIGPAIGPCCFEVGPDVAAPFGAMDRALVDRSGHRPHVDLPGAVAHLLAQAGVVPAAIRHSGLCTRCRTDLFYSHRGEQEHAGRLVAGIGLLE